MLSLKMRCVCIALGWQPWEWVRGCRLKAVDHPAFVQAYLDKFDHAFADVSETERAGLSVAAKRMCVKLLKLECMSLGRLVIMRLWHSFKSIILHFRCRYRLLLDLFQECYDLNPVELDAPVCGHRGVNWVQPCTFKCLSHSRSCDLPQHTQM